MSITITSKLTNTARRALREQSDYYALHENIMRPEVAAAARERGFTQISRNRWVPMFACCTDLHALARHMMTTAGQTFEYTIDKETA